MKALTLVSLSITSFVAHAEVDFLTDNELSQFSGQAGLNIDISALADLHYQRYNNQSLINQPAIQVGGHGNDGSLEKTFYTDQLDNLRVNVSLADSSPHTSTKDMDYGFSQMRDLAKAYLTLTNPASGNAQAANEFASLAAGYDPARNGLSVDEKHSTRKGQLAIHLNYDDPFEKEGGFEALVNGKGLSQQDLASMSYDDTQALISRAIDFSYSINEVDIALGAGLSSTQTVKGLDSASPSTGTRLMSNFSIEGYLGPHDLHLTAYIPETLSDQENANISDEDIQNGITWNSYFEITDLEVYFDVLGIQISDLRVHNNRGDLSGLNLYADDGSQGNSSFGFAHAQREINALTEEDFKSLQGYKKTNSKEGIEFNTRFKGDIDIGHLSFGDTGRSIGEIYITDFYFNRKMKIRPRD